MPEAGRSGQGTRKGGGAGPSRLPPPFPAPGFFAVWRKATGKPIVKHIELEPLPNVLTFYYPDSDTLVLETGAKRAEGQDIAHGLTVFYDHDDNVVGFTIECAELLLKPMLDSIRAKQGEK